MTDQQDRPPQPDWGGPYSFDPWSGDIRDRNGDRFAQVYRGGAFLALTAVELANRCHAIQVERDRLRAFVESLTARVNAQAEMLGRAAERRGGLADRVAELEAAIAPLVAVLVTGWDSGELPATALYPVEIGHLRRLSRALADLRAAAV